MSTVPVLRANLLLVLSLIWSATASAQGSIPPEHREWEASAFGGGSYISGDEFLTMVAGGEAEPFRTIGMDFASGYQMGVRIRQHLRDFWSADLEYSFANQPLRFTNLSPGITALSLSHSIHHFSYNVAYLPLPPTKRFRPYGKLGAGAALFYIHEASKDEALAAGVSLRDSWEFMFSWGAGAKYLVQDQFAITFEVDDHVSGMPSYGLPATARVVDGQYVPGISRNGFVQNWRVGFGLAFQWDDDW
jgi:opacity protein-like surface antigen